ncbi:SMI1/KNR4 family protein [uncultured Williamsia sp.]|uniref:SMI1/KNR4 family protein n=1 Tax=uncultured Williamsia sp. TaxID=259311 RepID=UPI002631AF84|nr:SMI1/KNR4 family protein [uncultured Williamsia sp.]
MELAARWESLIATLRDYAPATAASFRPGATEAAVARCEEAIGVRFPAELRTWFLLQNGQADTDTGPAGELLPLQVFFSLDEIVTEHAALLELSSEMLDYDPDYYGSLSAIANGAPNAGEPTDLFIASYIPISGYQNIDYFCDTRPGDRHGSIGWWPYNAGPAAPTEWGSIAELLAHIEHNLTDGPPDGWQIVVDDGAMYWESTGP